MEQRQGYIIALHLNEGTLSVSLTAGHEKFTRRRRAASLIENKLMFDIQSVHGSGQVESHTKFYMRCQ